MTEPYVVIVILTYNGWANTADCLNSIARASYSHYHIIIIDNGSTDETLGALRTHYPDVTVIENHANLGYSQGNNIGVQSAMTLGADYVLLFNPDVVIAPDSITLLVQAAEKNPDAAFLGPTIYHFDEPNVIQSAGGRVHGWQFGHRAMNVPDIGQFTVAEPVDWVTGCAILARCRAIEHIGLLDLDFFLYSEEVDWCLRAREFGYQIFLVPQSHVWHKGVQRNYSPSPLVTYYSARNELLLLIKHHAGMMPLLTAILRHLRTLVSYTVRPRWRSRRQHRDALAIALLNFAQGRFGPAPINL